LASEGIVTLGVTLSRYVCTPSRLYHVSINAGRISLGGEGNALYPVLLLVFCILLSVRQSGFRIIGRRQPTTTKTSTMMD